MRTIPEKESLTVEFKSDRAPKNGRGLRDEVLLDAVVSMSNSEGGVIFVGVEDDGRITGVGKTHADPIGVAALIANNTVPPVSVQADLVCEGDKTVLQIRVSKSAGIVATASGKVMRRTLKQDKTPENRPLYPHEYATRMSDLHLLDPSAQVIPGTTCDDLSGDERNHLRDVIRRYHGESALLSLRDDEFDQALGFVKAIEGKSRPTMTGLLMIGHEASIRAHIPTSGVRFQALVGTDIRTNVSLRFPIVTALERLEEYIKAWNPEHEYQDGLFRVAVPEFAPKALREGLVNAFCHRDYTRLGDIRVMVDDQKLQIDSPGGFIEGVTYDNLLTVTPHGRNPGLADALKRIGLAERTGRGIDRIFEGSARFGRPLPDYSASTVSGVRLSILRAKPDYGFMKLISAEEDRMGRPFSISALLVLSALHFERRLTLKELAAATHIPESELRSSAEILLERGLLTAAGEGRGRAYLLSSAVYKAVNNEEGYRRQIATTQEGWLKSIEALLAQSPHGMGRSGIVKATGLSVSAVSRYMRLLLAQGKVVTQGKSRSTVYKLP